MIVFPNAKINLGLNVTEKRPDGYHNIETIFYPVKLCDILEIVRSGDCSSDFSLSGLTVIGEKTDNLCAKAIGLLADRRYVPAVRMHLHKLIPMGAGLGGGSSDGAFTIQLMNKLFGLEIPEEMCFTYARSLGSDCAFFMINKPVFATGRGNCFQPANINLTGFFLVLVVPPVHVSTSWAYSRIQPREKHIYQPFFWKSEK